MEEKIKLVLDGYEQRIAEERLTAPPALAPGEQDRRMRAVGRETGRLINILARSLEAPTILELGTSYGYSGLWLAEAARATGGRLITMELHDYKSAYARDRAIEAGLADSIDFQVGDAVEMIGNIAGGIDFVLVDLWKDLYEPCLGAFIPKLNPGAIIVADNMRKGNAAVHGYGRAVRARPGMSSLNLPVGNGLEISRFEPDGSPYAELAEAGSG